jgi:hypothetical protein
MCAKVETAARYRQQARAESAPLRRQFLDFPLAHSRNNGDDPSTRAVNNDCLSIYGIHKSSSTRDRIWRWRPSSDRVLNSGGRDATALHLIQSMARVLAPAYGFRRIRPGRNIHWGAPASHWRRPPIIWRRQKRKHNPGRLRVRRRFVVARFCNAGSRDRRFIRFVARHLKYASFDCRLEKKRRSEIYEAAICRAGKGPVAVIDTLILSRRVRFVERIVAHN